MAEPEIEREAEELKKDGNDLFKFERYKEASRCYSRAIELKPDYHQAWHNLGVVWKRLGDETNARTCFQKEKEIIESVTSSRHDGIESTGREMILWTLVFIALLANCIILMFILVFTLMGKPF